MFVFPFFIYATVKQHGYEQEGLAATIMNTVVQIHNINIEVDKVTVLGNLYFLKTSNKSSIESETQ